MLIWPLLISFALLAVYAADRAWLRHVNRPDLPLHDPHGYLEITERMTELCHGDRTRVDALVARQRRRFPQATQAEVVRLAMRELLEPQSSAHP
ncbi:hypothetical protein [Herbaspirillum rubrisubalbicans]|uniref:Uncharacterized protein n=1 Tax=Herbaspirillum rubrisubalbicans Os34 TaxID=1235827 RepID=A0A6M3ZQM5_9BURK|nr:hypothetical protein [Herbaspirillum rubrisubalbicans]QJQ00935.1 hypothetical protein C798_12035 [Herbaspirillum rubrisubalbicans Os34]